MIPNFRNFFLFKIYRTYLISEYTFMKVHDFFFNTLDLSVKALLFSFLISGSIIEYLCDKVMYLFNLGCRMMSLVVDPL